jgi:hypothetical protein
MLLKKIWPTEMSELEGELEKLGDFLSDHHDLALLEQRAGEHAKENKDDGPEIEILIGLIEERRSELRLEARLLGQRIYAEKPGAFVSRLQTYWQTWRAESKSKRAAVHAGRPEAAA